MKNKGWQFFFSFMLGLNFIALIAVENNYSRGWLAVSALIIVCLLVHVVSEAKTTKEK